MRHDKTQRQDLFGEPTRAPKSNVRSVGQTKVCARRRRGPAARVSCVKFARARQTAPSAGHGLRWLQSKQANCNCGLDQAPAAYLSDCSRRAALRPPARLLSWQANARPIVPPVTLSCLPQKGPPSELAMVIIETNNANWSWRAS